MDAEVNFPRGRPKTSRPPSFNADSYTNGEQKRSKKQKRTGSHTGDFNIKRKFDSVSAEPLTYQKLQEGMLVLGCVRKITSLFLEIELPGRVFGKAHIENLSWQYLKYMKQKLDNNTIDEVADRNKLNKLYHVGQIIPTRVISIIRQETTHVSLSLDPGEINKTLTTASFKVGTLLWAAVSAVMDHGYLIDIGHENCRTFLSFCDVNKNEYFDVGKTFWCAVKKSQASENINTITVSAKPDDVINASHNTMNLHNVIPGTSFNFTVTKILKDGLEGKLSNDSVAYVPEMHLKKPLQSLKKYKVGVTYKTRLLYIEPLTNFVFLTFREINLLLPAEYSVGTVTAAEIISKTVNGVYIKLPSGDKGFVAEKRLLHAWSDKGKKNLVQFVRNKYAVGSKHPCTVLCYNHFEQLYICTLVEKKLITADDIQIGDLVRVIVTKHTEAGLIVKLKQLQGFIQNIHLTDGEYSENVKKKFVVGQQLKVRVWNINDRGVFFTNKKILVQSDTSFINFEDVEVDKDYYGIVAHIKTNDEIMLIFYGDVKGYIQNPGTSVFIGKVVLAKVIEKNSNEFTLTMSHLATSRPIIRFVLGSYANAVVKEIRKDCLIMSTRSNIRAKIPIQHLSPHVSLNSLLLDTYTVGDELIDLMCIDNRERNILSIREALQYKKDDFKICAFQDLEVGSLMRGFYKSHSGKTSVNITIPLKPHCIVQNIKLEDVTGQKKLGNLHFQPHQPIVLKVVEVEQNGILKLTGKLSDIYIYDEMISLNNLESYFTNFERIISHQVQKNSDLAHLSVGQRVQCVVSNFDDSGCMVLINNSCLQGLCPKLLCPKDIRVGQNLKGAVLWIDYSKNFVHVVLKKDVIKKIACVQAANKVPSFDVLTKAKVLMVKDEFVLGVLLNGKISNQIIYLPTFIHENSFFDKMDDYQLLEEITVKVCRIIHNYVIGLDIKHKMSIVRHLKKKAKQSSGSRSIIDKTHSMGVETLSDQYATPAFELDTGTVDALVVTEEEDVKSLSESAESDFNTSDENEKMYDLDHKISRKKGKNKLDNNEIPYANTSAETGYSSISRFFSNESLESVNKDDTSDDDTITELPCNKRRKLSAVERAKLAKQKEEEIRKKELDNADLTEEPQTSDQYDRLLLGKPNSSELWAKYIAFYLKQTEFDKAKTVAKRALQTIEQSEIIERFNIWLILLHFENNHGDMTTFEQVFEEAVRSNDPLDVYLEVIEMLSKSHKLNEMEAKIEKAKNKFKHNSKMWIAIAKIYFVNSMIKEARDLRGAALRHIYGSQEQIDLIIQFGLMEFRHGDIPAAEALFETLLEGNPKKTNVWFTYIDQVIKTGDIEKARRIFDRAMVQDISIKKKKSIFNKYREFEIKYGTKDTLTRLGGILSTL